MPYTYGIYENLQHLPEEWPWIHCAHSVAIKHLERADAFDAPTDEWIVIDRDLIIQEGYIQDEARELVSIGPSTITMKTRKGGMFVVHNPYHKYLMPKGDVLVPIEKYVDASRTAIVPLDYRNLPIPTTEGSFEPSEDYDCVYGDNYLPWTHLSLNSVKILKEWSHKRLEKQKELPHSN